LRPWPPPPSPPSDHRSPPLSPPYGCLQTLASIAPPPRPPSLLADSLLPTVSAAVSSDRSVVAPTQAPKPSFLLCGVVSLWISHDLFSKRVLHLEQLFGENYSTLKKKVNCTMASAFGNTAETSTPVNKEEVLEWVNKDKRRMLHVVYRVGDLDKTINVVLARGRFFSHARRRSVSLRGEKDRGDVANEVADGGGWCMKVADEVVVANNTFEGDGRAIGKWFLLISHVYVLQVAKTVDLIKAKGGKVTREPGPVKGGKSVIAFIEDPDGYKFELLERGPTPEPFCQVMLRVGDLDRSINFYEKVIWQ
ncbi:hypothetical protein BHE74_00025719, partial [Ensete ventricosum]